MQINGPSQVNGAQSLSNLQRTQGTAASKSTEPMHGADQLDISPEAEMVGNVHETADVRTDRIAEIRSQIEAGVYETDEKLDLAVGRMLDQLG